MTDDVKRFFNNLINKVNNLYLILITDRDGVPLLRVSHNKNMDLALFPTLIPTFTTSSDQATKLGLGRNRTIISIYSNYQVVQMNKLPLIVTCIGNENCNIGHILALEKQIDNYLDELKFAVTES
ncbi:ragulator complex protein LAMTOR3 homolog [Condylostylus longicornis]|uniref:ragulator complex protein LAMTOR3 homolog n=1 Tax=Condylostylus longicornis TaxID=2530218 RepID=UPI00244E4230|nr:ragulator complex protein LAMTOR3 homolog [Condylostylus longicornis]